MKNILSTNRSSTQVDIMLLIIRAALASMMLSHGIPKLFSLFSGEIQFIPVFGMSATVSLILTVFAEVFCSLFILFGLGSRLATLPPIFTMLVAVIFIHAADPFAKKELALLYLLPYIVLFVAGSGKYSLDYLLNRKKLQLTKA